jgi:hypothetical protein
VCLGVDGAVVCDGVRLFALGANLLDLVGLCALELFDDLVHDIDEDDLQISSVWEKVPPVVRGTNLVTAQVQLLGNEATADVTTAEVNCLLSHDC